MKCQVCKHENYRKNEPDFIEIEIGNIFLDNGPPEFQASDPDYPRLKRDVRVFACPQCGTLKLGDWDL